MTLLAMYDSVTISQIPADAVAVAGYTSGDFPTFPELAARFPHALLLSIAVSSGADAECLDIETGDATPADAPGWYERQRARGVTRPCLYANASTMESGIVPLVKSGRIPRASVRLWSAHYTGVAHICSATSCGAVSIDMDGTQWTDRALSRNLDQSLVAADFFGSGPAPEPKAAPPAKAATVPQKGPFRRTAPGGRTLAQIAAGRNTTPAHLVQVTAGALTTADVAELAKLPLPAGMPYYTTNP